MVETVVVCISCALSVLATGIAGLALRAADPDQTRRLAQRLRSSFDELQNRVAELEDVTIPRVTAQAEAILERAELKFDGAESKRKSTDAKLQRMGGGAEGGNGPYDAAGWMDTGVPEASRREALTRHFRGR